MWNFLPEVEFLETALKFRKRKKKKKKKSSSCVYVLRKTYHQEISRPSRAVTAKKGTKKCAAREEFFFHIPVAVAVVVASPKWNVRHSWVITGGQKMDLKNKLLRSGNLMRDF